MTLPIRTPFDNDPIPSPQRTPFDDDPPVPSPAAKLRARTDAVRDIPIEAARDAVRLSAATNLPFDVVARNRERIAADMADAEMDFTAYVRDFPTTASVIAASERNAALAKGDYEGLSGIERVVGEWRAPSWRALLGAVAGGPMAAGQAMPVQTRRGLVQAEYAKADNLLERGQLGIIPPSQRGLYALRLAELDAALNAELPESEGVLESFARASARIAPTIVESVKEGGKGAALGAAAGAFFGTLAGPAGTAAGAAFGAKVGGVLNAGLAAFLMEGGNAALEFEGLRDQVGQPVDPTLAYRYGLLYGAGSAAIEMVGLRLITKPFLDAARGAVNPIVREATMRGLERATYRGALWNGTKAWATAVGGETLTETAQQALQLGTEAELRFVSNVFEGTLFDGIPLDRVTTELVTTATETAMGMALLGVPGAASVTLSDASRAAEAYSRAAWVERMVDATANTATAERAPEVVTDILDANLTAMDAPKTALIPADRLVMLLQENDIPVERFAELAQVPVAEIEEALAVTGADVVLPIAPFIAHFAKADIGRAMVDDLRFAPGQLTRREAKALEAEMDKVYGPIREEMESLVAADVTDEAERFVVDDLTRRISEASRYTPDQVTRIVELVAKPYIVYGRKLAEVNPDENARTLYESRNLSIAGEERAGAIYQTAKAVAAAEARGASAEELGVLRDRLAKLSDERVAVRVALRNAEMTADVRDEAGRLRRDLTGVSDEALVLEYIRLRDLVAQAQTEADGLEAQVSAAQSGNLATAEEQVGALEEAGVTGRIPRYGDAESWSAKLAAYQGYVRGLRGQVRRYERSVPRLEAELRARGIENADLVAEERGFGADVSFDPSVLEQSPVVTQADMDAIDAYEVREMAALGATDAEIAFELSLSPSRVAQLKAMPAVPVRREALLAYAFRGERLLEQAAFHGSPYVFDRFDLSKIGTGEGAQAFGWGLYFAENEGVAEGYRKALAGEYTYDGQPVNQNKLVFAAAVRVLARAEGDMQTAEIFAYDEQAPSTNAKDQEAFYWDVVRQMRKLDYAKIEKGGGALYRVDIPDEAVARMLDWDKPLSEQAPEVREALKAVARNVRVGSHGDGISGGDFYARVADSTDFYNAPNPQREASLALLAAGIPGIKYLDAGSRGAIKRPQWASGADPSQYVEGTLDAAYFEDFFTAEEMVAKMEASVRRAEASGETEWAQKNRDAIRAIRAGDIVVPATRNLVVFDDALVTITHRNGEPVTAQERADFLAQEATPAALSPEAIYAAGTEAMEDLVPIANARDQGAYGVPAARAIFNADFPGWYATEFDPSNPDTKKQVARFLSDSGIKPTGKYAKAFVNAVVAAIESSRPAEMPETLDVDGVQRPTRNSEGRPIHPTEQGVRNFWRWFGDSKVVDAEGRPLVVYHGTTADDFTVFDAAKVRQNFDESLGFHFSSDPGDAALFAGGDGGRIAPVYVRVKNPVMREDDVESAMVVMDDYTGDISAELNARADADGVITRGVERNIDGSKVLNVVAVSANQIKSAIGNTGEFGPTPNILRQGAGRAPNGFYRVSGNQRLIGLMETADLSTVLHEFAHEYFGLMRDIAARPDAPATIVEDLGIVLAELGVASVDAIGVAEEERFARSFESYLQTADAPSAALARAFSRFRVWLTNIYRTFLQRHFPVSDALRGVFDRMLATSEEMEALASQPEGQPLFTSAEDASLTESEFAAYEAGQDYARAQTAARLLKQMLAETGEERRKEWQDREAIVRAEVEAEVDADPVEMAVVALKASTDAKLSKPTLVAVYGDGITKRLPPRTFAREGGVSADAAAVTLGFPSGDALVSALQAYEPRAKRVERLTIERMREEFPELLNDSVALADAAQTEAHRAATDAPIVAELKVLGKKLGLAPTNVPAIKKAARAILAETRVRDITPFRYLQAERKAATAAGRAYKAGDVAAAEFHKRQQLMNHILYREAEDAAALVEKARTFAVRMQGERAQVALGKAGEVFQTAMNDLLAAYDFSRMGKAASAQRERMLAGVAAWVQEMEREDLPDRGPIPVEVDDALLAPVIPRGYQELSFEALEGVYEAMVQVYHTGTNYGKEVAAQKKAAFEERIAELLETAERNNALVAEKFTVTRTALENIGERVNRAHGSLVKPEMVMRLLDGDVENGPFQRVFQMIADAQRDENVKLPQVASAIKTAMDAIPASRRKAMNALVEVPGLTGTNGPIARMTGWDVFRLALNYGNVSSREAVNLATVNGVRPFTDANVRSLLATMTAEEAKAVQGIWDAVSMFWSEIADLHQSMTGIRPKKVEAEPLALRTTDGQEVTLAGGYYPLAYDPMQSYQTESRKEAERAAIQEGVSAVNFTRAATRKGHLKQRQGSGGKMIWLSEKVLANHVVNSIHDLTHRRPLYEAQKLLTDTRVVQVIEQAMGRGVYREAIAPWFKRVAGEQSLATNWIESVANYARAGTTVVGMGLRFTTALMQPLGLFQSMDLLGPRWMARGYDELRRYGPNAVRAARELFPEIRARAENMDREIRDVARQLERNGKLTNRTDAYFWFIAQGDALVAVPTAWGAYYKWLDTHPLDVQGAINAADSAVRLSQGAGAAKDLSKMAAGSPLMRWWTMFYTNGSALYQLFWRASRNKRQGRWGWSRFFGSMMALAVVPAVLEAVLVPGRGPEEDDEDQAQWWLWQIASYPGQAVPLVRDALRALEPGTPVSWRKIEFPPMRAFNSALAATAAMGKQAVDALDGYDDVEWTRSDARAIFDAVGYWGHLPTGQAWTTLSYWYEWMMGYESPQTVPEALRNSLFTRPRP